MEFRPCDLNLLSHCVKTEFCTDCKFRIGCPIRHEFYLRIFETDIDFEIFLQTLELEFGKNSDEDRCFEATEQVRRKYYMEKRINPHFSYL